MACCHNPRCPTSDPPYQYGDSFTATRTLDWDELMQIYAYGTLYSSTADIPQPRELMKRNEADR